MRTLSTFPSYIFSLPSQLAAIDFSRSRIQRWIGFVIAATLLAAAQFHIYREAFQPHIKYHIDAAQGIIEGIPHWWGEHIERLLGPYMVEGLHRLTGWDFETSYYAVVFLLFLVFFFIILLLTYSLYKSTLAALAAAMAAGFLSTFLMEGIWLNLWDIIHLPLFAVLTWAILQRKPLWIICLLVVIELFNHPLFIIICAWLVLDSLVFVSYKEGKLPSIKPKLDLPQLLLGMGLGTGGYFLALWLRNELLLATYMENNFLILLDQWGIDVWQWGEITSVLPLNLEVLKATFMFGQELSLWESRLQSVNLYMFNFIIFGIPIVNIIGLFSRNIDICRVSILFLMLWGAIAATCLIYEPRVWFPFVPYLVLIVPMIFMDMFSKNLPPDLPYVRSTNGKLE